MIRSLTLLILVSQFFSCGDESEGAGETTSVPVFGADQTIQSRPVSRLDGLNVKTEAQSMSLLFAPNLKNPTEEAGDSSSTQGCTADIELTSASKQEVEIILSVDIATCDGVKEQASQFSDFVYAVQGRFGFSCEGADFSSAAGKISFEEFASLDVSSFGCDIFNSRVGMKTRTTSQVRMSASSDRGNVVLSSGADSEQSNKGEYCFREFTGEQYQTSPCRSLSWRKSFFGDPANENNEFDPDEVKSGAKLVRAEASLQNMTFERNDTFYRTGAARVTINGWSGTVNYENPLQSPEFNMNKGDGEVSVFYLPQDKPGSSGGMNLSGQVKNFLPGQLSIPAFRYKGTYQKLQSVLTQD